MTSQEKKNCVLKSETQLSQFFVFTILSLQFKFIAHSCCLITFPHHPFSYFLTSGYLLQTPITRTFFDLPRRFEEGRKGGFPWTRWTLIFYSCESWTKEYISRDPWTKAIPWFIKYHSPFLGNERFFVRLKSSRCYDLMLSFPAIVIVIEARNSPKCDSITRRLHRDSISCNIETRF